MHSILENATVLRDFFPLSWTATRLKVGNTWVLTWQWWWNEAGNPRRPRQHAIFIRTVTWWSFHLFRILNDWLTYPDLPFYFIYFYTAVCNRPKQDQLGCYLAVYCCLILQDDELHLLWNPFAKEAVHFSKNTFNDFGKFYCSRGWPFSGSDIYIQSKINAVQKYGNLSPASLSRYYLWSPPYSP